MTPIKNEFPRATLEIMPVITGKLASQIAIAIERKIMSTESFTASLTFPIAPPAKTHVRKGKSQRRMKSVDRSDICALIARFRKTTKIHDAFMMLAEAPTARYLKNEKKAFLTRSSDILYSTPLKKVLSTLYIMLLERTRTQVHRSFYTNV
jgi:hypothetical protein